MKVAKKSCGLALFLALTAACTPVRFYEKQVFSDRVMNLSDNPMRTHFQQKVFYSIEGAAGGIGASAGGGCGCY